MPSHCFLIGSLPLEVIDSPRVWRDKLPANYRPFAVDTTAGSDRAVLTVADRTPWQIPEGEAPLSEVFNDLGVTHLYRHPGGWLVSISPRPGDSPRLMLIDPSFARAELRVAGSDPMGAFVLDSMLRIFFSQYAATRGALLLHASAVELDGNAYLFMGRSGTGKSTHTRLWVNTFPGASIINDDVPLVQSDARGIPTVFGTPWSGKGCVWRRVSAPLRGIARLRQHPADEFIAAEGIDAFIAVLPGISVMTADIDLYSRACTTILAFLNCAAVTVGTLLCTPRPSAARLSRSALTPPDCSRANRHNTI